MVRSPVGKAVDQPGIAVKGKNDRLVFREQRVEVLVAQSMRMFCGDCNVIRSTTLMTLILSSGMCR